jgi:hypothetical protein
LRRFAFLHVYLVARLVALDFDALCSAMLLDLGNNILVAVQFLVIILQLD